MKKNAFLYHEKALEPSMAARVQEHLDQCETCRNHFQQALLLKKALKELPRRRTSPDFNAVLRARLRTETYRKPLFSFPAGVGVWQVPAYAGLALIFVALGAVLQRNWNPSVMPSLTDRSAVVQTASQPAAGAAPFAAGRASIRRAPVKNYVDPGTVANMSQWAQQSKKRTQTTLARYDEDSTWQMSRTPNTDRSLVREVRQVRF
ncbi:MAG TPA: zf-HC2 domain-containing protein [bacterium]|nr:zf-HC2 domain-containing protein [bacterium]HPN36503.1 zf-HC2 domain-containing protein [bacterium]